MPPTLEDLPYPVLAIILLEYLGEDLIVRADGTKYAKLVRVCKLFKCLMYSKRFRERMMQSMAAAMNGTARAVMNKITIVMDEGREAGEPVLRMVKNRLLETREICNRSNPFTNPFLDKTKLLGLMLNVTDPHEMYRMALPYINFNKTQRFFEFGMDWMRETISCSQWYQVGGDKNNVILLKHAWQKGIREDLEVWSLLEFALILDYRPGRATGWTIGRRKGGRMRSL